MKKTILLVTVLILGPASITPAEEDTWTYKTNMPAAKVFAGGCVVDGKIYIIGGAPTPSSVTSAVEMYDPVTDTWTRMAEMPSALCYHAVCTYGGKIYVFGGAAGLWSMSRKNLYVYDPPTDTWTQKADMCIMVDHWQTDYPPCDIAPPPFGDGIIDVQDLIVLAENLFEVYPSADTVDVDEADSGGQVELELGQILVVTLESNPSIGYQWEILENNESILKQFGQVEFKQSETSEPPMVGAGGWEIFRFKAEGAGQTMLELVYHRPWEDAEPLKTFSIQAIVN